MQAKRNSHGQTNSLRIRSIRIEQIVDVCNILNSILSNEKHMLKSTHWINFSPKYPIENDSKGCKKNHNPFLLQETKAKYFFKIK